MHYVNQREIAHRLGVSRETIRNWREAGRLPPPDATYGLDKQPLWDEARIDTLRPTPRS